MPPRSEDFQDGFKAGLLRAIELAAPRIPAPDGERQAVADEIIHRIANEIPGWSGQPERVLGVHDYDSLVACLTHNFEYAFPGHAPLDPQGMIQMMAGTILNLREKV